MDKLKIEWYVCTYNEEFQLPFAIDYWKRLITDKSDLKVFVYDNQSTDKTVEILKQYPWIEVKEFTSNNEMNENLLTYIRNNCWKSSKADWVMMTDLDEVFYAKDIVSELIRMKEEGVAVVACKWLGLIDDKIPKHDGRLLHNIMGNGYKQHINHREGQGDWGKLQLFDPKKVTAMNYSPGMHISYPDAPITFNDNIFQFHFDKGYSAEYKIKKRRELWKRLNSVQKQMGYCYQYNFSNEQIRKEHQDCLNNSIDISGI